MKDKATKQLKDIENLFDFPKNKGRHPFGSFNVRFYSDKVISKYHIACDKYNRLWIYNKNDGIWLDGAEKDITEVLRNKILEEKHLSTKNVNEVINDIRGRSFDRFDYEEPDNDLIPFANKGCDIKKKRLFSYRPKYFFINKFPVDIDMKGKCPTIDKIFTDLVGEDKKEILYELAAYCMYRGYPYQKIFILIGNGSNGKSTYKEILSKLIGHRNICSVSIGELVNSKFGTSQLHKKYLNLCGELDNNIIRNTAILKQITGNDLINGERKFKDPFSFVNYAKVIITTNSIPETLDRSTAFYRRIYLVDFPNKFEAGKNAVDSIADRIPEKEYRAFAYECVKRLINLKKRRFVFSNNESVEKIKNKYEELSSPLSKFLKGETIKDIKGKILAKKLNNLFLNYLERSRIIGWSHVKINKGMEQKGYLLKTKGVKNNSGSWTTKKYWIGIRWKN